MELNSVISKSLIELGSSYFKQSHVLYFITGMLRAFLSVAQGALQTLSRTLTTGLLD